jgi:hypothetical protein
MGENENLDGIFNASELAELKAAANDVVAQVAAEAPKKNGLWYVKDEGTQSLYAVNSGGKTVLWFTVDNTTEMTPEQVGGHLPLGVTAHRIVVWNSYRTVDVETNGFAARYLHDDGTGTHIDGDTVRAYALPRIGRWLGHFYGV